MVMLRRFRLILFRHCRNDSLADTESSRCRLFGDDDGDGLTADMRLG